MTSEPSEAALVGLRRVQVAAGAYAMLAGASSLLGWVIGARRLVDWLGDGVTIKPNAALAALFSGVALLAVALRPRRRHPAAAMGAAVALLGLATLVEHVVGVDLGIDTLLFDEAPNAPATAAPGRMGMPASISFVLVGGGLLALAWTGRAAARAGVVVAGLAVASIAALSLVGYLYRAESLYMIPRLTGIALQTATLLLALGVGLLASVPERGVARLWGDDSDAGVLLRRTLPWALLLPVAAGWLRLWGQRVGLYGANFGTALGTLVEAAAVATLLVWGAQTLRERERQRAAAEARARAADLRAQTLLANLPGGAAFVVDRDLRYLMAEGEALHDAGVTSEGLVGRTIFEALDPALAALYEPRYRAALGGGTFAHEHEAHGRHFLTRGAPLRDDAGVVSAALAFSHDITARVRAEEALRRSEGEYRALFDGAGTCLAEVDPASGRFVRVNRRFCALAGYAGEELVGARSLVDLMSPEGRAGSEAAFATFVASRGSTFEGEQRWVCKDGSTVWIELAGTRLSLADGGDRLLVSAVDVTERRRQAARLDKSERRMQLAVLVAGVATWDLDLLTGENHWSDSHFLLLGYAPTPDRRATEDMWRRVILDEDLPAVMGEWARAERERDVFRAEHRLRRADDGRLIWGRAAGRFSYDSEGRAVRFVGVFYDITEQKEAERVLREEGRRKDEFLATLAHELRNPLAPIVNAARALGHLREADPVVVEARAAILRQSTHMVRLVDDLLDVNRIRQGKLTLRRERSLLAPIVDHAVETVRPLCEANAQRLEVTLPEAPLALDVDPARIAQVIGNLLHNAARYTPRGGNIAVSAVRDGAELELVVRDDGPGVPPDKLDVIFELFGQLDRSMEGVGGGLGIGLHLVRRLVELHGGKVTARSEGVGSEFIVRLPLAAAVPASHPPAPPEPVPPAAGVRRRILVVDDSADSADSLVLLLTLEGHDARAVYSGAGAVESVVARPPDLVLMDLGMPEMDGYEACRQITERLGERRPRMVAMTGWGQERDRQRTAAAGFERHLVKPVDYEALTDLLRSS